MRGVNAPPGYLGQELKPNTATAETQNSSMALTSTGFLTDGNTGTYIYIAIRRGPMKVPTDATKVFIPLSTPPSGTQLAGFVPDMSITKQTDNTVGNSSSTYTGTRIQGNSLYLQMNASSVEGAFGWQWDAPTNRFAQTSSGTPTYSDLFGRAPGFFDVVCYAGNAVVGRNVTHNLAAVPELFIVKGRDIARGWFVYSQTLGASSGLKLELTAAASVGYARWNGTTPTASVFTLGGDFDENYTGYNYIAYLFATCPGVSKVGSYTGTGATQTVSCGFTGGARFVMIKRTDSTGNWWYWDTARGMVSGNDSRLPINAVTVEAISNWVFTATGGFQIVTTDASVNASGGTYIFLAIA